MSLPLGNVRPALEPFENLDGFGMFGAPERFDGKAPQVLAKNLVTRFAVARPGERVRAREARIRQPRQFEDGVQLSAAREMAQRFWHGEKTPGQKKMVPGGTTASGSPFTSARCAVPPLMFPYTAGSELKVKKYLLTRKRALT